jgi:hypothetical protein
VFQLFCSASSVEVPEKSALKRDLDPRNMQNVRCRLGLLFSHSSHRYHMGIELLSIRSPTTRSRCGPGSDQTGKALIFIAA